MIIGISIEAANDVDAAPWLDRLLWRVNDGWHKWDVTGLEQYAETVWMADRRTKLIMDLFRKTATRDAYSPRGPHNRRIQVVLEPDPNSPEQHTPESAFRLADQELIVLVENRNSDGRFIERAMQELDRSLWRWWHQEPAPARFDSLGGTGEMLEELKKVRGDGHRPRYVVVVDSDRRAPEDKPSDAAQKIARCCDEEGFPCWVLAKRESENYLPRMLLVQKPDAGQEWLNRVDVWQELSAEQKDFYDMKHGLSDEPSETERKLFGNLTDTQRSDLSSGFGSRVSDCWAEYRGQAHKELEDRSAGDIEHGLALIRNEV